MGGFCFALMSSHITHVGTEQERKFLSVNRVGTLTVGEAWGKPITITIPAGGSLRSEIRTALRPVKTVAINDSPRGNAAYFAAAALYEARRALLLEVRTLAPSRLP